MRQRELRLASDLADAALSKQGLEKRLEAAAAEVDTLRHSLVESEKQVVRFQERADRAEEYQRVVAEREQDCEGLRETVSSLREELAREKTAVLERERSLAEQRQLLAEAKAQFQDAFKGLSSETLSEALGKLRQDAETVLKAHREAADGDLSQRQQAIERLVQPLTESLKLLDEHQRSLQLRSQQAFGEVMEQLKGFSTQQNDLRRTTDRLVKALQSPGTAGQWGEMVLQRVAELAGLQDQVCFNLQETIDGESGRQRPDMVVNLPGERRLIVDAKAPMKQYFEALEAEDEGVKAAHLQAHAKHLLDHAKELKRRGYGLSVEESPDMVVMFVPSESAFRAALEHRPNLIEETLECQVLLASPLSLLGVLRVVEHSWRQERLAQSARDVREDAAKLYEAVCRLAESYAKLGRSLEGATKAYNEFGGTLEGRVLVVSRRLKDHGVKSAKSIPTVAVVETATRVLVKPELTGQNAQEPLLEIDWDDARATEPAALDRD